MKIYYAHAQSLYGTKQETRDIACLESLGFEVVNPNSEPFKKAIANIRERAGTGMNSKEVSSVIMLMFKAFLGQRKKLNGVADFESAFPDLAGIGPVDAVAFRGLPGCAVPAGVWGEIQEAALPTIELPTFALRKVLTVDETRAYLSEIGQR